MPTFLVEALGVSIISFVVERIVKKKNTIITKVVKYIITKNRL